MARVALTDDTGALYGAPANWLTGNYAPTEPVIHDDFSRHADGPLDGKAPLLGPAWKTTGATPTTIEAGRATATGYGYAYATLPEAPSALTCEVEWENSAGGGAPMTMNWSPTNATLDLGNLLHLNFSATAFNLTVRQDGGAFDELLVGKWDTPMIDGQVYRVSTAVQGRRITVYGPNGEIRSASDPRVKLLHGGNVFWEPVTVSGSKAYLHSASAFAQVPTLPGPYTALGTDGEAGKLIDAAHRLVGTRGSSAEMSMGTDPTSGQPTVTFGANKVFTELTSAIAAGATTISTVVPLASGTTVQIESGANKESVTTTGYSSGSGPYTSTLTAATTLAHPKNSAVFGDHPAGRRTNMSFNLSNGFFYMPDRPVVVLPGGRLYLGGGLDASVLRVTAAVSGTPSNEGWRTGRFTTAGRPSASAFGPATQIYDTTLSKPLWSDGTVWRDAMGTAV